MTVVLGGSGQLGFELRRILEDKAVFLDHARLDFQNTESVIEALKSQKPSLVINAAAYTAVDLAEKEREAAFRVNAETPGAIARLASELNFKFVHISTDYVFNGEAVSPYLEEAEIDPINVYGESKAEGERLILENDPNSLIVRTSWVYSSHGKNFVKTVLRLAAEKRPMKVVDDQIGSLTWAADLAGTLLKARDLSGVYHFSNEGVSSWYDVAYAVRRLKGLDLPLSPISSSEYPTPARRPRFSLLNKQKIKSSLGIQIPHWMESLEKCLNELS